MLCFMKCVANLEIEAPGYYPYGWIFLPSLLFREREYYYDGANCSITSTVPSAR
jgi:hypothetical protein